MNRFSCRFEFTEDYSRFIVAASKRELLICTSELGRLQLEGVELPLPDIMVEFTCDASLETVRDAMRTVPDLHIAIQSLRPVSLKDNSLERDFNIL